MKFLGTIVITDPCYIKESTSPMSRDTIYGDWSCMVYPGNMKENKKYEEWDEYYTNFFHEYNFTKKSDDEKKALSEDFRKFKEEWKKNILGEFCADSGQVAIFEWDKLNSDEQRWVLDHPWCATIIKDFFGDVEFNVIDDSLYVIGTSQNHTNDFFSTQSGY